jgi:tetratricopeptide (TPR) repeat protein
MRGFELRAPAFVLAGVIAMGVAAAKEGDDLSTREIMSRIVAALQVALPPSFDEAAFQDPEHRADILGALEELAGSSQRLERHTARSDAGLAYLSHSLASDAREVHARYADGRFEQARFLLHNVTDVCVACHSRLPDEDVRTLGRSLLSNEAIARLPLDERAQYEIATRQFDRALETLEAWFADPAVSPGDVDLTGEYEDYLEVSLRVRRDPQRAIDTFSKLLTRDDLPDRVRRNVETWVGALEALKQVPATGSPIVQARALMQTTKQTERTRDERSALVSAIAASGILHRYVAAQTGTSTELGYAYYLLGVIEADVGRSFWASQTEHYLETAIRIGPSERYAEPAFELLEAFVVAGYTGSGGEHVPPDVRTQLAELRDLIDREKTR